MRVQAAAAAAADMLCPLCRGCFCSDGWTDRRGAVLSDLYAQQSVPVPTRPPAEPTARRVVGDYTLRTFTEADVPVPHAPERVSVLCCRRLAAVTPCGETLLAGADPAAQALLHSQFGPFAGAFLTTVPVSSSLSYPRHLIRVLLLHHLRLLLLLLSAPAGAVAFWTPSATIVQLAPGHVCTRLEGAAPSAGQEFG